MQQSVAIIGAGVSGLAAAACALRSGLRPTVFERANSIGGMWNDELRPCWRSLRMATSKFTAVLSDFPWPPSAPLFPSQSEAHAYLSEYARTRLPGDIFRFDTRVTEVAPAGSEWRVEYETTAGRRDSSQFRFVVVASGFFAEAHAPADWRRFCGTVLHSSEYRGPQQVAGRRVIVAGGSMSGAELAADVAEAASEVLHLAPHGFWVLPRLLPQRPDSAATPFLPADMIVYALAGRTASEELVIHSPDDWIRMNSFMRSLCGGQQATCSEQTDSDPTAVTVSDTYSELLRAGKIRLIRSRLRQVLPDSLQLQSGESLEARPDDVLLACTGYRPDLHFLSEETLRRLEFDAEDRFCPLILHRCMLHPELPGLAFVGMYNGTGWSVIQLQAEWAIRTLCGAAPAPGEAEMAAGLQLERLVRAQTPRPQFPHPDVVGICNDLFGRQPERGMLVANAYRSGGPDPSVDEEIRSLCSAAEAGRLVAGCVHRALRGSRWSFRRSLRGRPQSADASGVATFSSGDPLLYTERGSLTLQSAADSLQVHRQYAYAYDEASDELSVHFVQDGAAAGLFHRMQFAASPDGWLATGSHLCGSDVYRAQYCFRFRGCLVVGFTIRYSVSGPEKDYESLTEFSPADS